MISGDVLALEHLPNFQSSINSKTRKLAKLANLMITITTSILYFVMKSMNGICLYISKEARIIKLEIG